MLNFVNSAKKKMKILVTGASGFLGKEILKRLFLQYGKHNVIGFSRKKVLNMQYCEGGILNFKDLKKAIKGIDIIVHLVASSSSDSKKKQKIIIKGMENLIKAAKQASTKKIVFMSSYAASRKTKDTTGLAKLEAENLLKHSKIPYTILRPTLIYGKGARVFNQILKSTSFPIVPILGDGKYLVGPVYVKDVAKLTVEVIKSRYNNKLFTILGDLIEYNKFIEEILEIKQKKIFLFHIPINVLVYVIQFLKFLHIIKFDKKRLLRAVESVENDEHDFRKEINFKLTNLKKGLKESILV